MRVGRGTVFWAPRILTLLFAAFLGVFALDAFSETKGVLDTVVDFVMHLTPSLLVLLFLALAWRWEWIGVAVFGALGVLYILTACCRFHWSTYVVISGPLFVISLLFLVSWRNARSVSG